MGASTKIPKANVPQLNRFGARPIRITAHKEDGQRKTHKGYRNYRSGVETGIVVVVTPVG
jgi:hypothetical protein